MSLKPWSRAILLTAALLAMPALSMAQVSLNISVNVPPPELPIYEQPPIPGDGYIWTPGYWAWGDDIQDYYWVPGTWVLAPQPDYLWTPGYWGFGGGGLFIWHSGYWGPHVGFYGGVDYGYGYSGEGYHGGYWRGGRMYYNRSVNNISNVHITNVYNRTVVNNDRGNRVSYNGGNGGIRARPSAADNRAGRDRHLNDTPVQREHEQAARGNPVLRAKENNGRPPIAATPRPGNFSGAGVVAAKPGGERNPQGRNQQDRNQQDRSGRPDNRGGREANPAVRATPAGAAPVPTTGRRAPGEMQPANVPRPATEQRTAQPQVQPQAPRAPQMQPQESRHPQTQAPRQPQVQQQAPRAPQPPPQAPRQPQVQQQAPRAPQAQPQAPRPQQAQRPPQQPRPAQQERQAPRPSDRKEDHDRH